MYCRGIPVTGRSLRTRVGSKAGFSLTTGTEATLPGMRAVFRQVRARPRNCVYSAPVHRFISTSNRRGNQASSPPPHEQSSTQQDSKQGEQKTKDDQKAKPEPERDTTVAGRSPWQAFVDVLKEEVQKNREWQTNVKALGGEVDKVQDSAAMKRAREAYERARVSDRVLKPARLVLSNRF